MDSSDAGATWSVETTYDFMFEEWGIVPNLQSVGGGAITPVGALGLKTLLPMGQGSITPVGVLGRLIKIAVGAGSITTTGVLGRLIKLSTGGGSITPIGVLTTILRILQSVGQGIITPVGALNRLIKIAVGMSVGAATETLRPNAAGDETSITFQYPASTEHWDKVDEAVADDASTSVREEGTNYKRDLYNLPAHSAGSGTINKITVYVRCLLASPI